MQPLEGRLPEYDQDDKGEDYLRNDKSACIPWIVRPSGEARLDGDDPLGWVRAVRRPRIAKTFASSLGLRSGEKFGRVWMNQHGRIVLRSQAWGRESKHSGEPTVSGVRLLCSRRILRDVLTRNNSELLLLIKFQRYEKEHGRHSDSKFRHTIVLIRVTKALDIKYYKGRVNHLYKPSH